MNNRNKKLIKVSDQELGNISKQRPFLSSKQMAIIFGYKSDDALRKQRCEKRSLFPYIKVGRRVFYDLAKVLQIAEIKLIKPE